MGKRVKEEEEGIHMPPLKSFWDRMYNRCMSKASNDKRKTAYDHPFLQPTIIRLHLFIIVFHRPIYRSSSRLVFVFVFVILLIPLIQPEHRPSQPLHKRSTTKRGTSKGDENPNSYDHEKRCECHKEGYGTTWARIDFLGVHPEYALVEKQC